MDAVTDIKSGCPLNQTVQNKDFTVWCNQINYSISQVWKRFLSEACAVVERGSISDGCRETHFCRDNSGCSYIRKDVCERNKATVEFFVRYIKEIEHRNEGKIVVLSLLYVY